MFKLMKNLVPCLPCDLDWGWDNERGLDLERHRQHLRGRSEASQHKATLNLSGPVTDEIENLKTWRIESMHKEIDKGECFIVFP